MNVIKTLFKGRGGISATLFDESHDDLVLGEWWRARGTLAVFYEDMRSKFLETGALSKPDFDKVLKAVSEAVEAVKECPNRINRTRNVIYKKRLILKGLRNEHYLLYYYGVMSFIESLKNYRPTTEMHHPEENIYHSFCFDQIVRHTYGIPKQYFNFFANNTAFIIQSYFSKSELVNKKNK